MAVKILKKAQWLWQDYVGAKWKNLKWANTGDNKASYVYPQGKNSKSSYRPKSLFYHYQYNNFNTSKYEIVTVKWIVAIGKYNKNVNDFPSLKVFYGDNNAPYKKTPIKKVAKYSKRLPNEIELDNYVLEYDLKGITPAQLKNLIIEMDFSRTKAAQSSTISVNRARLEIVYQHKDPLISIYDSVSSETTTTADTINWKVTAKNSQKKGNGKVKIVLPAGVSVVNTSGNGSYNTSTKEWTFTVDKNKAVTRTFRLKFNYVGVIKVKANNMLYPSNANVTRSINVTEPPAPEPAPVNREDTITLVPYETFAKEEGQYFDVIINGYKENHVDGTYCCYLFSADANLNYVTPIKYNCTVLESDNCHLTTTGIDHRICLDLDTLNEDFSAKVRIPIYPTGEGLSNITITDSKSKTYTGTLTILEERNNIFITNFTPSRDKQYVQTSINVGVPNIWTIRAKSHNHNFSDEKKSDFVIAIEKLIAYIGCIPLSRGHKEMEKANTTNTLIDNTYLNRRYLGKEGDTREDIPMTLRMKWQDVATLQGLAALDKPIPIDTIPELPDGDPVNHRGWAELTAVKNIWKVNDLVYECQPEVHYLTHALLTKFAIEAKDNLTENKIDYFLSETLSYNDNLLERFNVSYSQFWTNLEDEYGNITGTYELEPSTDLYLNSIDVLKDYSTYNIKYRNEVPALMSEDYDKNWEMAIRVLDKDTGQVLFEHLYNNFKHYDFNNGKVINTADVTTKVLQGTNYNVLNFDNMVLGYDSLAPLLEESKSITHFNTLDNTTFNNSNTSFELFLLDNDNIGLPNEMVELWVTNDDDYIERFDLITDLYGRFKFNVNLENGSYNLECRYYETDNNMGCTYSTDFTVAYTHTDTAFSYGENFVTFVNDSYYEVTLTNSSGTGLNNKLVYYSFRDLSNDTYQHEESVLTDSNGRVLIPVIHNNGSKELKVSFKGDASYNPCFFETIVDINIQGKNTIIESDNVELVQGDAERIYNIILKDDNGVALKYKPVRICYYRQDENYIITTTTNEYGVATAPIYLNKGAWKVDSVFNGDDTYKPVINTNDIIIKEYIQLGTSILSENIILDESEVMAGEQDYYTLTLIDEYNNVVPEEPVNILVYNNDKSEKYVDVVLYTNEEGEIEVPFLSHGETVLIESKYYGCNKYKPTNKSERVSFEENVIKDDVTFFVENNTKDIYLTEGTNTENVLVGVFDGLYDIIVNPPSNNRVSNKGANYLASLNAGTFNVTFVYHGTENYYPQMTTITYTHETDTRVPLSGGMVDFTDMVAMQGLDNEYDYEYTLAASYSVGSLKHLRINCDYDLPDTVAYIGVGYDYGSAPTTLTQLTDRSEYVLTVPAKKWYSPLGARRSYLDFDFVVPTTGKLMMLVPKTDFTPAIPLEITINVTTNSKAATSITQSGFGTGNKTYQDMFVNTTNSNADNNTLLNEYFIAKVVNTKTFEELYYYSYLVNKQSPIELKFLLEKGTWRLNILSKETTNYKGAAYVTSKTLSVETNYDNNTLDPLFKPANWTDKGQVSISGKLDATNNKIESTSDNTDLLYSIFNKELTTSNNYKFSFDYTYRYDTDYGDLYFGLNSDSTDNYDGIWVALNKVEEYKDNDLINRVTLTQRMVEGKIRVTIERRGTYYIIYFDNKQVYISKNAQYNNFGVYLIGQGLSFKCDNFELKDNDNVKKVVTPDVDDLNTPIFGSDLSLKIEKNKLSLIDYGMLPEGDYGAGRIILNDVLLQEADYELEIWINYNNSRFERLNNLQGLLKMNIYEDISMSDAAMKYANIQCSPVPVPNSITRFTRLCDEGTMYYVEVPTHKVAKYLCNPYIQYKGGTDLKSETGISIFNLDNAYSPVMLSNGLVRAEFHRHSGYIVVSRYDEETSDWYKCNTFKLANEPNLYLDEDYSDDKATVRFGNTKWTIWRGRPFIKLENPDDDLRILDLVDRVYCETIENEFNMGFVEEYDENMGIFNPQPSVQQLKQELHVGQNIRTDNFEVYDVAANGYLGEVSSAELDTIIIDNDTALQITSANDVALNFPTNDNYVKKPGKDFSLLIEHNNITYPNNITVKARGFDDNGAVPIIEGIQYGIWEQSKTWRVGNSSANITSDDLYVSYISGTYTKTANVTSVGNTISIINTTTDNGTLATITLDPNHLHTYDYGFTYPCVVEFDLIDYVSPTEAPTNTRLQFYDTVNNSVCSLKTLGRGHIKAVVSDGLQEYYCDGELKHSTNLSLDNFRIALQTHYSITIRNLRVRWVPSTWIDDDKLYISKDSVNVDTATLTTYTVSDVEEYLIEYNSSANQVGTVNILEGGNTQYVYNDPLMVEFDVVSYTSPSGASVATRAQLYDKTNNSTCAISTLLGEATTGHVKIIANKGKQEYYCDGVLKKTTNLELENFRIAWQTYGEIRIKNIRLSKGSVEDEGLRVTFTDCPNEVKYVDFIVYLNSGETIIKDIMVYEGDSGINHEIDTSRVNANNTSIIFTDSFYACLYDEDSPCGLAIVRPKKEEFTLRRLLASEETVLIPYMKRYTDYDDVTHVILEYFNSKNQIINVDWEG